MFYLKRGSFLNFYNGGYRIENSFKNYILSILKNICSFIIEDKIDNWLYFIMYKKRRYWNPQNTLLPLFTELDVLDCRIRRNNLKKTTPYLLVYVHKNLRDEFICRKIRKNIIKFYILLSLARSCCRLG